MSHTKSSNSMLEYVRQNPQSTRMRSQVVAVRVRFVIAEEVWPYASAGIQGPLVMHPVNAPAQ
jgi:hypothetical protein